MKIHSGSYLIGEGFKNIWVNRLMSIASIGVLVACMVLIGLASLVSFNVDKAMKSLEQNNVIMVYLNDVNSAVYGDGSTEQPSSSNEKGTSSLTPAEQEAVDNGVDYNSYKVHTMEDVYAIRDSIAQIENVASAEAKNRDDLLEDLKAGMLSGKAEYFEFLDDDNGNPLSHAVKVTLIDLEHLDDTVQKISMVDGVDKIYSHDDTADKIITIKKGVTVAGGWIICILLIIALVIVSNTIRVTMYNRKLEISIMKVVGATDSFIRIPFIIEGVALGIISALISECVVYFCYRVATETMKSALSTTDIVRFGTVAWLLFGIFAAIGVIAGIIGSLIMINKYLHKEGSEFRAL